MTEMNMPSNKYMQMKQSQLQSTQNANVPRWIETSSFSSNRSSLYSSNNGESRLSTCLATSRMRGAKYDNTKNETWDEFTQGPIAQPDKVHVGSRQNLFGSYYNSYCISQLSTKSSTIATVGRRMLLEDNGLAKYI